MIRPRIRAAWDWFCAIGLGLAIAVPYVPLTERGRRRHAAKVQAAIDEHWASMPNVLRSAIEADHEARGLPTMPTLHLVGSRARFTAASASDLCPHWLMLDHDNFHAQCALPAGHGGDHTITFTTLRAAGLHVRPF